MATETTRKMYMGIWGFMLPLPPAISVRGLQRGVAGAKAKADRLTTAERRLHHFIVRHMTVAQNPIATEFIAAKLDLPLKRTEEIVAKLEAMKTFCYRYDSPGINWAYPFALEDTGHRMTAASGQQFFAA